MRTCDLDLPDPTIRRRGPKPVNVRAQFAATAWLDGDILWREGHVVWRCDNQEKQIGPRELEAASRALAYLQRHPKAARRHCPTFEAWYQARLARLKTARQLVALTAPDLQSLTSQSRRHNPSAIERLVELLAVEGSVAQPLPFSPARALFEAWPLSQMPLQRLLRDENQILSARALAALVVGAARPHDALPGEPYLRRAARYGAKFGFPPAPELCVAQLKTPAPDVENATLRVQNSLNRQAPLGWNATQLLALHHANRDATFLADIVEATHQLSDHFPALNFAPVAPARFDVKAQCQISRQWNELRQQTLLSLCKVVAKLAERIEPRDLHLVENLLHFLIAAPIEKLGAIKIEKGRMPRRRERSLLAFQDATTEAVRRVLQLLDGVAEAPHPSESLQLLLEASQKCSVCAPSENTSPSVWASRWQDYVRDQIKRNFSPLLRLAARLDVAGARRAIQMDCWRDLARHSHLRSAYLVFILDVMVWVGPSDDGVIRWLSHLSNQWTT